MYYYKWGGKLLQQWSFLFVLFLVIPQTDSYGQHKEEKQPNRPNILLIISDDQSWPHAGAYGADWIDTPNFDRIADQGTLFHNAFASAPSCAPSRFSILTGRPFYLNQEGGIHGGFMPNKYPLFTHLLKQNGYHVGATGKDVGPFHTPENEELRYKTHPLVTRYNTITNHDRMIHRSGIDYAENFRHFMKKRESEDPFLFIFNSFEPHRPYKINSGRGQGKTIDQVEVPDFLPDHPEVRADLLDYAYEIEAFDKDIGRFIQILKETGAYDNTLIIVTSDNGMPFPNAKMQSYEFGHHVPLAISWPGQIRPGREVHDLVTLPQLAPTILEVAGIPVPVSMTEPGLYDILTSKEDGLIKPKNDLIAWGKEKHNLARKKNLGYPIRAARTHKYLYIRNFTPERWPAGNPPYYVDWFWWPGLQTNRTARTILQHMAISPLADILELGTSQEPSYAPYFDLHTGKRPEEELYNIQKDPYCLINLADIPAYSGKVEELRNRLMTKLKSEGDPRALGEGEKFDSTPTRFTVPEDPRTGRPIFQHFPSPKSYLPGYKRFDHSNDSLEAKRLREVQ
ncbi:sulfatase [Halalkalibaculum sp. DA384]|uniref:sulfatase family protein n=1 Tax=Halalkalibaculum sp. DA384 TaxID=3373606 RepID=UPI0037545B8A